MTDSVLLLGGTDITIAVANAVIESGAALAAIVTVPNEFAISYSKTPVVNFRSANVSSWASSRDVRTVAFDGYKNLLTDLAKPEPVLCLVAGWYHMVPAEFRDRFVRGCYGFHASLLPHLRGGAPLNWAILKGYHRTGVTLFELGDGVDDGLVFGQCGIDVAQRATIAYLVEKSRGACSDLTRDRLGGLLPGTLSGRPQIGHPSYALQRVPDDGRIDWRRPAFEIDRLIRAVGHPYPGAYALLDDEQIRIWDAEIGEDLPVVHGAPGQIARIAESQHPCVVTGDGLLVIASATGADGSDRVGQLLKSNHKRFLSY